MELSELLDYLKHIIYEQPVYLISIFNIYSLISWTIHHPSLSDLFDWNDALRTITYHSLPKILIYGLFAPFFLASLFILVLDFICHFEFHSSLTSPALFAFAKVTYFSNWWWIYSWFSMFFECIIKFILILLPRVEGNSSL